MLEQKLGTAAAQSKIPDVMRAAIFRTHGSPMIVEQIPTPRPNNGEILVRVAACGVCHTDLHVIKGEVGFPMPAVLGHEISGTVVELGEGVEAERGLDVGNRVVGAFIIPCGVCGPCAEGRDDLCHKFFSMNRLHGVLYDGTTRLFSADGTPLAMYSMGGLAEYAVVPATGVAVIPHTLPLAESAVVGCAAFTAFGAVRNAAEVRLGEAVAVVAMGGVGSNIVQIARAHGASVIVAVDIDDAKLALAKDLGATHTVNAAATDAVEAVRAITAGVGVDVAFEVLGNPTTFRQASEMLRDGGRLIAVGIADGTATADIEITRLVRRSQRVIGSYGARTRTDLALLVALINSGQLHPHRTVTRSYDLSEVADAYAALARGAIQGRAIVTMGEPEPSPPTAQEQ